ncbi:MAG: gliding motility-associated C-terminal domain-containing protein [Chitinophagales bacterium]|nr:gliding motility-associated C-terminal domain-containing protein [Chitinophagaceae bacterium]MCB9064495.1 gliding motility-associated C-terminal domain-containing protein [Chitinophagales bacterium]
MRKSLLLVVLMVVSLTGTTTAQRLFDGPDTVCINQAIQLSTKAPDAKSHYWGFCSAYLRNTPTGVNMNTGLKLDEPSAIVIGQNDDGNYYAFATNIGSGTAGTEFLRYDFGESLDNTPVVTSYGNMDSILPAEVNSMYMVRDDVDKHWYIFLTAGKLPTTAALARIDFGTSLANTPNIVNFGNLEGKMSSPTGVFVAKSKSDNKWYGYFMNSDSSDLKRLNLDTNISLTPSITDVTLPSGALNGPSDLGALVDNNGRWTFYVTNASGNGVTRIDMNDLANLSPSVVDITGTIVPAVSFSSPYGIMFIRDCDKYYGFVINKSSHRVIRIEMGGIRGPYTATNVGTPGGTLQPTSITRAIRDRDNVYSFILNQADSSMSRMKFAQCTDVNIQYSLSKNPPEYRYTTPGLYNVYYATNEGLPDMDVDCKLIYAADAPPMIIMPLDTTICEGDSTFIEIVSINAISFTWTPNYNISNTNKEKVIVWPERSTKYRVRMPFPIGTCIVDTTINVSVVKLNADAGPDRTIADGASTKLGGPYTTTEVNHLRRWFPDQYIDNIYSDFPVVSPPHDFTYYLLVSDTAVLPNGKTCQRVDTVNVYVGCDGINLANAFTPERGGPRGTFGLANQQIVRLNKFNIYDRWGKQVFTTTDPTNEWDGTINGEKAAVGVYIFEVDGFCNSGKRIQKTGNVMLIR